MHKLYGWQQQDVDKWVAAAKSGESTSVFVMWEQSLGKTLASVEYARGVGAKQVIVIAPLNTRTSWEKTVREQLPDVPTYRITSAKNEIVNLLKLNAGEPGWYLIGWELMRTGMLTNSRKADLVIADETHRQQNRGSLSHQTIIDVEGTYKLALSGTPAGNRPDGIWATLHWLWPKKYSSHQRWVDTMWRVRRNGAIVDFVREATPGGVLADIPLYSRRRREDHRDDLPQALPEQQINVDMTPAQWKLYNQIVAGSAVWIEDEFVPTSLPLIQDLRLTQITLGVPTVVEGEVTFPLDSKSSKLKELFDVLAGEPDDATMLVFVPSARFIPAVVHQLNKKKISAVGLSGTLTPPGPKREAVLEAFGNEYRVLVASIAAIAEGTDGLQYKCSRQFWLAKHSDNKLNQQAKWRLDRPGQTEPVQSWYTVATGTVDEDKIEKREQQEADLADMIDHGRGAEIL